MITPRKSHERGHANHGWLDSYHSFSFADYHDPEQMGFSALRVINEDRVAPGAGFPTHSHRDMEIITYVLEGGLRHRDSLGNGSVIVPGDVQKMSAGSGVSHSEFNDSKYDPVHFLQIWIVPRTTGIVPAYQQAQFAETEKRGRLRLIASPDGREGSLVIHQDALVYASVLEDGDTVTYSLHPERRAYVQVARGSVELNGHRLEQGDGARLEETPQIVFAKASHAELLLFDLA
ncbi:MAG: pirin family protein [Burkholderiales bacterium]